MLKKTPLIIKISGLLTDKSTEEYPTEDLIFKQFFILFVAALFLQLEIVHACADSAAAVSKVVDAAADGKTPPKINARVFGKGADGADDFSEVLIEGGKIKKWKDGVLVDVDPKDINTMRAFVKDANGRRVHSFITSPEAGQKAVSNFFDGISSGKIDPTDARAMGNKFKAMSEADQATLVGGIENKLRAGQQITEAEFLIAVKGTPGFRTLQGAAPHLDDLQKAYRSGNLSEALGTISKSWNVGEASAETQGRVARIGNLLGQNISNKPVEVLTDLGQGQRMLPQAVRNADDVRLPATTTQPGRTQLPARPNQPSTPSRPIVPGADDIEVRTVQGEVLPPRSDVTVAPKRARIEADPIEGTFTRVNDGGDLTLRSNRTPARTNNGGGALTIVDDVTPTNASARVRGRGNPNTANPPDVIYLGSGQRLSPTLRQRLMSKIRNNKLKTAGIGVIAGIMGYCLGTDEWKENCIKFWECQWAQLNDPDNAKEVCDVNDYLNDFESKVIMEKDGDHLSCTLQLEGPDGVKFPYAEMKDKLTPEKEIHFKWEPKLVEGNGFVSDEKFDEMVTKVIEPPQTKQSYYCEEDNNDPSIPCVIRKELIEAARENGYEVQYNMVKYVNNEAQDPDTTCTSSPEGGITPTDTAPSQSNDGGPVSGTPNPTVDQDENDDDDDSSGSFWGDDDEEGDDNDRTPGSYVIDPYGILKGNAGKKTPLAPPQLIRVPPDTMPPYVSPGYY